MAHGRSTKIILMIQRIQISRFSINNSLSKGGTNTPLEQERGKRILPKSARMTVGGVEY